MLSERIDWPALNAWLKSQYSGASDVPRQLETRVCIGRDSHVARVIVRDAWAGTEVTITLNESQLRSIGALQAVSA